MLEQTKTQRPRYRRADHAPAMRFQDRDGEILQAIYDFDGVITRRHLKQLFWPSSSQKAMQARLSKLYHNGYLDWPDAQQRRVRPIPEPLVWLGWRGILALAGSRGVPVNYPAKENENQLRLLQSQLRKHGIRWVREPNWNQPLHEIAVADFRLSLARSLEKSAHLELEKWIPESIFRADTDVVQFNYTDKYSNHRKRSKGVIPDGFFVIKDHHRSKKGKPHRALFLLEVDMASHDNTSFGIEKAAAGGAYIHSPLYKKRFGTNAGRWLVVTTGKVRLQNLIHQTHQYAQDFKDMFYFTTQEKIQSHNLLTEHIWRQPGNDRDVALPFAK